MRIEWIVNSILSSVTGAVFALFLAIGWSGWMSLEDAERLADQRVETAVAASWTPYCVSQSQLAASRPIVDELRAVASRNRPGVIQRAGWATPIGKGEPNWIIARTCALALAAQLDNG